MAGLTDEQREMLVETEKAVKFIKYHYNRGRNDAIEEFAERIKREFRISVKYKDEELRWIDEIADQLKKEGAV